MENENKNIEQVEETTEEMTASMGDNETYTFDVDPGMTSTQPQSTITSDLVTGISMSAEYEPDRISQLVNDLDDINQSIVELKQMVFELVQASGEDRDKAINTALTVLDRFHQDTGLSTLDYHLRDDITDYETALLKAMNLIIVFTDLKHTAEVYQATLDVSSLQHDLTSLFENIGSVQNINDIVGENGELSSDLVNDFIDNAVDEANEEDTNND